ncbi:SPFH domain-containing protein [Streptomyces sp. NPDC050848]|uniref:SPFH domain-containing protein n=1 Tax=Streptomyces sp. NPDC050848 TaxID=3155791 RepID=UPI0033EA39C1
MTATTPNPDSGAAASRDAARTARRLTTEPRAPRPTGHPPEPGAERSDGAWVDQMRATAATAPAPSPAGQSAPAPAPAPGRESSASASAPASAPVVPEAVDAVGEAPGTPGTPGAPSAPATTTHGQPESDLAAAGGGVVTEHHHAVAPPAEGSGPAGEAGEAGEAVLRSPLFVGPPAPGAPGTPGAPVARATSESEAKETGSRPTAYEEEVAARAAALRASLGLGVTTAKPEGPAAEPRTADAADATAPAAKVPPADGPGQAADLRTIVRGEVGVVAVPVAAEAHVVARPVVRRKNVIGTETTGSIPVHLLFRDEPDPDATATTGTGPADDLDDDGGPATVAMAVPTPPAPKPGTKTGTKAKARTPKNPKTPKATIPAPTRPKASRPAPTADPKLVERAGPVLPGWIGVVAGVLALAGCAAVVWWAGAVPEQLARMLRLPPRPYQGIHLGQWALLALGVLATLFTLGGLGRGRVGYAWVLTLFGDYRGTVRRTGLVWVSPLLLRRRVDVRLRHWRSEPLPSVDAKGTALNVVVLVVWRIRDTVRAALGVEGHEEYLREQVEAAMARVLSQLPADAFHEDAPTLRDAEAVGEALTRMLSAECAPVGIDVFSAQPTRIEYAPEIAAAMQRRRIAAIDAKHRDSVLTSVVDAVDDVVHRLTTRGLVELDDYERKALVKDLTVAFYTGRTGPVEGA